MIAGFWQPTLVVGLLCFSCFLCLQLTLCRYLGIWTVAQHYWVLPYWAVLLFGLAASSGIVWLDAASVITSCHNLPAHQGLVAGKYHDQCKAICSSTTSTVWLPQGDRLAIDH